MLFWACPSPTTAVFSTVIANEVKHPSLRTKAVIEAKPRRHCERSEAISKEIPTIQYEIALGFAHRNDERLCWARVGLLRASLSLRQSPRRFAPRGSAGGSLRSPPPSASLTQFSTNYRWWLFTLSPFGA